MSKSNALTDILTLEKINEKQNEEKVIVFVYLFQLIF
jgi:hypothetical protein